jgi:hypothetical protein
LFSAAELIWRPLHLVMNHLLETFFPKDVGSDSRSKLNGRHQFMDSAGITPPSSRSPRPPESHSEPITIVIPASYTDLTKDSFPNAETFAVVKFETGSQIRRLESGTFHCYTEMRTICIAASVEFLGRDCFPSFDSESSRPRSVLQTVTFEAGSKLREIEPGAFLGCRSLRQLLIPASVEKMSGKSLPLARACQIEIESGNRHFAKQDDFVIDLTNHSALRYLGSELEVRIPEGIEKVDEGCFASVESIRYSGSSNHRSWFGSVSFGDWAHVRTITIPSSVALLGDCCFRQCSELESAFFCSGSPLGSIPMEAFFACSALESIVLPSSVKTLGVRCFCRCLKLVNSPLPVDSEVVRIEPGAFWNCSLLTSVFLPSSIEFIGEQCFQDCDSLSILTFGLPSHLRELLDLPPNLLCFVSIPDSVEVLSVGAAGGTWFGPDLFSCGPGPAGSVGRLSGPDSGQGLSGRSSGRTLSFGRDSRLADFEAGSNARGRRLGDRTFVQFSSGWLKRFRMKLEFGGA